ncbi:Kielin/chordin-like protein, partial [Stegodyphus mimosarum]
MKNNTVYENDEEFIDPENPCLKCHCKNGSIMCSAVECPPVKPCRQNAVVVLDGECCPFCSTCGPHHEGSYWMES